MIQQEPPDAGRRFPRPHAIELRDVPEPECGEHQVLVRVARAGLCGTDVHIHGGQYASECPLIPGHEFCGVVERGGGKGKPITGIEAAEKIAGGDVKVFHAGTKLDRSGDLVTDGGRALNVCALGATLTEARDKANAACERIHFEGGFFRRDIGHRVMR